MLIYVIKGNNNEMKEIINLPKPKISGKMSLEEAINKRSSIRNFSKKNLSLEEISQILWSAYGERVDAVTEASKTVPSGGALYPMEIYLVLPEGLFHYLPKGHKMEKIVSSDLRNRLANAALRQNAISNAAGDIVIVCIYERICSKYGQRGKRYAHIEAGHIGQNIHLEAVSLGLGSVPIGAFDDYKVQEVLNLPKDHVPLYIIPVGYINN